MTVGVLPRKEDGGSGCHHLGSTASVGSWLIQKMGKCGVSGWAWGGLYKAWLLKLAVRDNTHLSVKASTPLITHNFKRWCNLNSRVLTKREISLLRHLYSVIMFSLWNHTLLRRYILLLYVCVTEKKHMCLYKQHTRSKYMSTVKRFRFSWALPGCQDLPFILAKHSICLVSDLYLLESLSPAF